MKGTAMLAYLRYRRSRPTVAAVAATPVAGPVILEGVLTGDGRIIEAGALTWPDDPVPVIWDRDDGDHTGQVVGTLTSFERLGDGRIWGEGMLSATDDPEAEAEVRRLVELVEDGAVGWSASLDQVSVRYEAKARKGQDEDAWSFDDEVEVTTAGRVRQVAIVDTPRVR